MVCLAVKFMRDLFSSPKYIPHEGSARAGPWLSLSGQGPVKGQPVREATPPPLHRQLHSHHLYVLLWYELLSCRKFDQAKSVVFCTLTHAVPEGRPSGFWHAYSCIFSEHVKISEPGHSRSGHQPPGHVK